MGTILDLIMIANTAIGGSAGPAVNAEKQIEKSPPAIVEVIPSTTNPDSAKFTTNPAGSEKTGNTTAPAVAKPEKSGRFPTFGPSIEECPGYYTPETIGPKLLVLGFSRASDATNFGVTDARTMFGLTLTSSMSVPVEGKKKSGSAGLTLAFPVSSNVFVGGAGAWAYADKTSTNTKYRIGVMYVHDETIGGAPSLIRLALTPEFEKGSPYTAVYVGGEFRTRVPFTQDLVGPFDATIFGRAVHWDGNVQKAGGGFELRGGMFVGAISQEFVRNRNGDYQRKQPTATVRVFTTKDDLNKVQIAFEVPKKQQKLRDVSVKVQLLRNVR